MFEPIASESSQKQSRRVIANKLLSYYYVRISSIGKSLFHTTNWDTSTSHKHYNLQRISSEKST